jgi:V8-like Glu-specific endopeptidase
VAGRRYILTAALAAAVAACAVPSTAAASDVVAARAAASPSGYWTPARMQDAIRNASPHDIALAAGARPAPALPGMRTVGRVFSVQPNGENYACSGTLVDSPNRSLVWTAGHCIHRGKRGGFHTSVVFVPAYQPRATGQPAPFGVWRAAQLGVPRAWARLGRADSRKRYRPDLDGGAIVLARDAAGRTLTDALGFSQHISFPHRVRSKVRLIGYPLAAPFGGEHMTQCGPQRARLRPGSRILHRIHCTLGQGMSGGPALRNMNTRTGIGTVVGPVTASDTARLLHFTVNPRLHRSLYRQFSKKPV